METEAQKPQNHKNYENCPKRIEPPVLIPEHLVEYIMTGGALRICARLLKWTNSQLESGLIIFDLLEAGFHGCKTAATRQAGHREGKEGNPLEWLERTSV